jgi:hypothetical protein
MAAGSIIGGLVSRPRLSIKTTERSLHMLKRITLAMLLLSLSLGVQIKEQVGPEVEITLSTGRKVSGEILAVRSDAIVFTTRRGARGDELVRSTVVLPEDTVGQIVLPGSSNVLLGIGVGAAGGCLAGAMIGSAAKTEHSESDFFGCARGAEKGANTVSGGLIGFLAGGTVGGLVGGATSDKDIVLIDANNRDFSGLRSLARYKGGEPEYLRQK